MAYVLTKLFSFIFFLTVSLETNYVRMYWIDLHQIFSIDTYMGGHDYWTLFRPSFRDLSRNVAMVTDFWRHSAKIGIQCILPSFCVLAFHNGWMDRNMDAGVNTADDTSASDKNLVNFSPLTPFCRRICAGLCSTRISSYYYFFQHISHIR